jgi:hypothetical protein
MVTWITKKKKKKKAKILIQILYLIKNEAMIIKRITFISQFLLDFDLLNKFSCFSNDEKIHVIFIWNKKNALRMLILYQIISK